MGDYPQPTMRPLQSVLHSVPRRALPGGLCEGCPLAVCSATVHCASGDKRLVFTARCLQCLLLSLAAPLWCWLHCQGLKWPFLPPATQPAGVPVCERMFAVRASSYEDWMAQSFEPLFFTFYVVCMCHSTHMEVREQLRGVRPSSYRVDS